MTELIAMIIWTAVSASAHVEPYDGTWSACQHTAYAVMQEEPTVNAVCVRYHGA